jgi:hypothetical protein
MRLIAKFGSISGTKVQSLLKIILIPLIRVKLAKILLAKVISMGFKRDTKEIS